MEPANAMDVDADGDENENKEATTISSHSLSEPDPEPEVFVLHGTLGIEPESSPRGGCGKKIVRRRPRRVVVEGTWWEKENPEHVRKFELNGRCRYGNPAAADADDDDDDEHGGECRSFDDDDDDDDALPLLPMDGEFDGWYEYEYGPFSETMNVTFSSQQSSPRRRREDEEEDDDEFSVAGTGSNDFGMFKVFGSATRLAAETGNSPRYGLRLEKRYLDSGVSSSPSVSKSNKDGKKRRNPTSKSDGKSRRGPKKARTGSREDDENIAKKKGKAAAAKKKKAARSPVTPSPTTSSSRGLDENDSISDDEEMQKKDKRTTMHVRVLMKYLELKDPEAHAEAKVQIEAAGGSGDGRVRTRAAKDDGILLLAGRLRSTVGESHWNRAGELLDGFLNQNADGADDPKRRPSMSSSARRPKSQKPTAEAAAGSEAEEEEEGGDVGGTGRASVTPTGKSEDASSDPSNASSWRPAGGTERDGDDAAAKRNAAAPSNGGGASIMPARPPAEARRAEKEEEEGAPSVEEGGGTTNAVIKQEETDDGDDVDESSSSSTSSGEECHFQLVVAGRVTDLVVKVPRRRETSFLRLRREIEEEVTLPFQSFQFTLHAGGATRLGPKQEQNWKKWSVWDYLTKRGDGSCLNPYRVFVEEGTSLLTV